MQASLIATITEEEIKNIIFSSSNSSSLGPDGFPIDFYKQSWHIIGSHVLKAVKSFFVNGYLPKSVKATAIYLIPKKSHAKDISNFRSIALCNSFYKIITKIISNRMKSIMKEIIHDSQVGFIKNRISTDNVILASEILREINFKKLQVFVAKYDIQKAFDIVSRNFLLNRLASKGFPQIFIKWIEACIKDVYFSICINRNFEGFFISSSSLRQWCHLSSYIFTIIMDAFSCLMNFNSTFKGFVFKDKNYTHLLYADDLIIFGKASRNNIDILNNIFVTFSNFTGLFVNHNKSFCIIPNHIINQQDMLLDLNINKRDKVITYLGLPISNKKLNRIDFNPLCKNVNFLLEGWKCKSLSFAGRIQFIKFIIMSLVLYWYRVTSLPASCNKHINKVCSHFLYHGDIHKHRLHLISWSNTYKPKINGGLGILSIDALKYGFNYFLIDMFYNCNTLLNVCLRYKYHSPWKDSQRQYSVYWNNIVKTAKDISSYISFINISNHYIFFL